MGLKVNDTRAIPLCADHHTGGGTPVQPGSIHNTGATTFAAMYHLDYELIIQTMICRFHEEQSR